MLAYESWIVIGSPDHKNRVCLGHFEELEAARKRVCDSIAGGEIYGFVKQGADVLFYLNYLSPTAQRIVDGSKASPTPDEAWQIQPCSSFKI